MYDAIYIILYYRIFYNITYNKYLIIVKIEKTINYSKNKYYLMIFCIKVLFFICMVLVIKYKSHTVVSSNLRTTNVQLEMVIPKEKYMASDVNVKQLNIYLRSFYKDHKQIRKSL